MIKKIKENLVFNNKFFNVYNDNVLFNKKKEGTHLRVESPSKQDGIAVLPVLKNGNILLIKNYRYAIGRYVYQVVKGGNGTVFKNKELAVQCMREELEEEANLVTNDFLFLSKFYESPSLINVTGYSFIALDCEEPTERERYPEDTESIDSVLEIPFTELELFLESNEVCSISAFLIQKYINIKLKESISKN